MKADEVKFGFCLSDTHCFCEMFDSVQELLEFAIDAWDEQDGDFFNEDDENVIYVGTINSYAPSDFAPSLDDIADQMTDRFYTDHSIDNDEEVKIYKREEAQKEWHEFINKYFDIPCTHIANWVVGMYDVKARKWVEKYASFDKYVEEKLCEEAGVTEPVSKTFPRANEFEVGSSYRR
jgi:hypothetical protein